MSDVYRTIADFDKKLKSNETAPIFMSLLKSKWDEIHNKPNVFRYKIDNLKERIVDEKYLLQVIRYFYFLSLVPQFLFD